MTNEEVLNIIKLKYKDVEFFGKFTIIFNKNIAPYYDGCKRISYSRLEEADDGLCLTEVILQPYDSFKKKEDPIFKEIEFKIYLNNILELKHILGIEITREDIILYLTNKFGESYSITDVVVGWELNVKNEFCDDFIVEIDNYNNSLILEGFTDVEDGYTIRTDKIFKAINSNEYWRLYNIINSLIEE